MFPEFLLAARIVYSWLRIAAHSKSPCAAPAASYAEGSSPMMLYKLFTLHVPPLAPQGWSFMPGSQETDVICNIANIPDPEIAACHLTGWFPFLWTLLAGFLAVELFEDPGICVLNFLLPAQASHQAVAWCKELLCCISSTDTRGFPQGGSRWWWMQAQLQAGHQAIPWLVQNLISQQGCSLMTAKFAFFSSSSFPESIANRV